MDLETYEARFCDTVRTIEWMQENVTDSVDARIGMGTRNGHASHDHQGLGCNWWECYLPFVRRDTNYPYALWTLKTYGFLRPVGISTYHQDQLMMHNGHHRLAAAIELGMTEIPLWFSDHVFGDETTEFDFGSAPKAPLDIANPIR